MEYVVLGLGSNRRYGDFDCIALLEQACTMLKSFISGINVSSIYKTGAMYVEDQEDFYNMVAGGFYDGSPEKLLDDIHKVEQALGRNRKNEYRNGPRSMDVDIEIFGNERINKADLVIPHERLMERAFVLRPLLDLFDGKGEYLPSIENNAIIDRSSVTKSLDALKNQKIQKFMDKEEFLKYIE